VYTFAAGAGPPPTGDDRFRIGSVSETFLAVIVLQLAAEGRLRLDDNLARYVHVVYGPQDRITLRQLLGHTSGLANYGSFFWWLSRANRRNDLQPLDLLNVAETQPRTFTSPGSSFAYSLTDYIALGLVVEKVTGHPVTQELTRRIVRPLRLSHTELPSTRTVSGLHEPGPGINPNLLWAASGIVSTARDLSRFFSALLSGRLVPRTSLKAMEQTTQDPARA
jgi:D-alanyl-D-alanine carboxypeptidase